MDIEGCLIFAILLKAPDKGVTLEHDPERVEVAAELSRGRFFECCDKKLINGKVQLRVKPAFVKEVDDEIKRRRTEIKDSTSKILLTPSRRIVTP